MTKRYSDGSTTEIIIRCLCSSSCPGVSPSPVGNDDGVVELAPAVLPQGGAPPVGDDGVGAVQLVEAQVVGGAGPAHRAGAARGHGRGALGAVLWERGKVYCQRERERGGRSHTYMVRIKLASLHFLLPLFSHPCRP